MPYMSSLTTIRNGPSSHIDSGDPGLVPNNNGSSSYLLRIMSTPMYVVSSYAYWLFTSMFPPNQGGHDEVNATSSGRDVEMGRTEGQAEACNGLQPTMADILLVEAIIRNQTVSNQESRVGEEEIHAQYTEPEVDIITENQTLDEESRNDEVILTKDGEVESESNAGSQAMPEAASGRDLTRDVSGEHDIFSNPQSIGVQVVGIWIIPSVIGAISFLIRVVVEDQKVKTNQKFLLNLCFGASLTTIFLGLVGCTFSIMAWKNPRRFLIIKFLVIMAFGSAFVDVCLLITFGFIVMQSNVR